MIVSADHHLMINGKYSWSRSNLLKAWQTAEKLFCLWGFPLREKQLGSNKTQCQIVCILMQPPICRKKESLGLYWQKAPV